MGVDRMDTVEVRVARLLQCECRGGRAACRGDGRMVSEWIDARLRAGENKARLYLSEQVVAVTLLPIYPHNATSPLSLQSCLLCQFRDGASAPPHQCRFPCSDHCTEPVRPAPVPLAAGIWNTTATPGRHRADRGHSWL